MTTSNLTNTHLLFASPTADEAQLARTSGKFELTLTDVGTGTDNSVNPITVSMASTVLAVGNPLAFISNVKDPLNDQDAATKKYVDDYALTGVKWKAICDVATVGVIVLAPSPATIDGYTLATGDRVLVKNQGGPDPGGASVDNGIYVFDGTNLTRSVDMPLASDAGHAATFVINGAVGAGLGFHQTTNPCIVGTNSQDWIAFTLSDLGDMKTTIENDMSAAEPGRIHFPASTTLSFGNATFAANASHIQFSGGDTVWTSTVANGGDIIIENLAAADIQLNATNAQSVLMSSTLTSGTSSEGSLIIEGGVGMKENLNIAGIVKGELTTDSTSTGTGAMQLLGGLGVAKNVHALQYFASSDIRLKKDIVPITDSTSSKLHLLKPVEYKWKEGDTQTHLGFIAQDLENIFPDLVKGCAGQLKSISYTQIVPLLVKEVQILREEINVLKDIVGLGYRLPQGSQRSGNPTDCTAQPNEGTDAKRKLRKIRR